MLREPMTACKGSLLFIFCLSAIHSFSAAARAADVALQVQAVPTTQPPTKDKLLSIVDAVRIGLDNHPRIKAAEERTGSQEAILGQQMSAYYPTINFNSSYRTTNSSGSTSTSSTGLDTFTSQANINFILYNFGKREGTVQAARETVEATREDYLTTTQDIILSI